MYIHVMMSSITFSLYIAIASRRPNLGYAKSSNILFKQARLERERERGSNIKGSRLVVWIKRRPSRLFVTLLSRRDVCVCAALWLAFFQTRFPAAIEKAFVVLLSVCVCVCVWSGGVRGRVVGRREEGGIRDTTERVRVLRKDLKSNRLCSIERERERERDGGCRKALVDR